MKPLRITLFILAFLILGAQSFRHAYIKWLEPRGSVLDRYDTSTEKQISGAKSLQELLALYDIAHTNHTNVEKEKKERASKPKSDDKDRYEQTEASRNESTLRSAIEEWEHKSKEIVELWWFWSVGLIFLIIGGIVYLIYLIYDLWIGMSLVILAFTEMIWATSPTMRALGGAQPEFHRLLTQKFLFSIITLVLLLGSWFVLQRFDQRQAPRNPR